MSKFFSKYFEIVYTQPNPYGSYTLVVARYVKPVRGRVKRACDWCHKDLIIGCIYQIGLTGYHDSYEHRKCQECAIGHNNPGHEDIVAALLEHKCGEEQVCYVTHLTADLRNA